MLGKMERNRRDRDGVFIRDGGRTDGCRGRHRNPRAPDTEDDRGERQDHGDGEACDGQTAAGGGGLHGMTVDHDPARANSDA